MGGCLWLRLSADGAVYSPQPPAWAEKAALARWFDLKVMVDLVLVVWLLVSLPFFLTFFLVVVWRRIFVSLVPHGGTNGGTNVSLV